MNAQPTAQCSKCPAMTQEPLNTEEDPLCPNCIGTMLTEISDVVMGGLHDKEMAAGHYDLAHDLDPVDWYFNHGAWRGDQTGV